MKAVALQGNEAFHLLLPLTGGEVACIRGIVVIAHDTDYAIGGVQLTEDGKEGFRLLRSVGNEIAGEHDEVRGQGIDLLHGLLQPVMVLLPALQVKVADLHNAKTIESWGNMGMGIFHTTHLTMETAVEMPIGIEYPPPCHQHNARP